MRIGSKKWVLFKFIPYEYKALERYLEKIQVYCKDNEFESIPIQTDELIKKT